jgi:branched-chain amino acid transport system ATP-binding protein
MENILELRNVTKRFGGVTAVDRCSLGLAPGKIYGLIGPNGSGKTTLFNCITGLESCEEGEIFFKGERIDGLKPHQVTRRRLGRTFQVIRIFPELTALENLLVVTWLPFESAERQARKMLELVTLDRLQNEYAGNLSYGQQKLLELSRVLMTDPDVVLLDEPAAGVNRSLLNEILQTIRNLRAEGKTIFIVEHDMKVIMDLSEKIFVLNYGEKIAEGTPELIQTDERVVEAYFGR